MKKFVTYISAAAIFAGCTITTPLQIQVTPLGEEPAEVKEQYLYALPQTILKVEIAYQEVKRIPGPYWEYAEKYLGIKEVIKQKSSEWKISDVAIAPHNELDPEHFFSLNVMDGVFDSKYLHPYLKKGVVMDGTEVIQEGLTGSGLQSNRSADFLRYLDLGVYANFEERTETMYKTLVTDTSYVEVPVQRRVVEQKSPSTKAAEAADFLLELRTRRFDMLTGEYEVYPDGEAMAAAIKKLDQLEASYLSLFTGKTVSREQRRTWFILPESGSAPTRYTLEMFSDQLGFVPAELMEGLPLEIKIEPLGKTNSPASYFSDATESGQNNTFYYRIPDVAILRVMLGNEVLSEQRISIFQSGAIVTKPIN